jgi:hypothetical protein
MGDDRKGACMDKTYIVQLPDIPDETTDRTLKELEQFYKSHQLTMEERNFLFKAHATICVFQLSNDGKLNISDPS